MLLYMMVCTSIIEPLYVLCLACLLAWYDNIIIMT